MRKEILRKHCEELAAAAQSYLDEIDDENEELENRIPYTKIEHSVYHMSFAQASELLATFPDLFQVGDVIVAPHALYRRIWWDVIGRDIDKPEGYTGPSLTLQTHYLLPDEFVFELNNSNVWATSDVRHGLNGGFLEGFDVRDQRVMAEVTKATWHDPDRYDFTSDKIFLLSAAEMGFEGTYIKKEGKRYPFFDGGNVSRIKTMPDNDDYCWYWTRSCYPSGGYLVRSVNATTGALSNVIARYGHCVAPACVIIASNASFNL